MVSRDEIEAEGLTTEDVLDVETAQPQTDVQILPEWEKHPEERPGENLRIEGNTLLYERDGFERSRSRATRRPTGALISRSRSRSASGTHGRSISSASPFRSMASSTQSRPQTATRRSARH